MDWVSLFTSVVLAAETVIISPLTDNFMPAPTQVPTPAVSFGQLVPFVAPAGSVLGAQTAAVPPPKPLPTRKRAYTIALLGDSMIDTLGPDVPHLRQVLTNLYPTVKFNLLNYGVGGTNIDYGLERLTSDYLYLGNHILPLVSQIPDIVVIESFAYNPYSFDEGALDRHWLQLAKIVDILKTRLPGVKIVIAATIAPNSRLFGDGAPGLSYDATAKKQKTATIKKYLENAVRFAQSQHLPLADAYHASLDSGEGQEKYINPGDHIHYSDAGRELFGQKVAETIAANHLLE